MNTSAGPAKSTFPTDNTTYAHNVTTSKEATSTTIIAIDGVFFLLSTTLRRSSFHGLCSHGSAVEIDAGSSVPRGEGLKPYMTSPRSQLAWDQTVNTESNGIWPS